MNSVYLNSANLSRCPGFLLRRISEYQEGFELNPTLGMRGAWTRLRATQERLAGFFNGNPDDFFFRTNITSALNAFIMGVALPKGSEILVGEHEYGAIVNICRLKAEQESLNLRVVAMPSSPPAFKSLDSTRLVASIVDQLGKNTRMLLLSHVLGGSGLVLPIEPISKITRERDILFVVDASYATGALPIDINKLASVDFYGSSLYKFMRGPKGTAFGWVPHTRQEGIAIREAGWHSFDCPNDAPAPKGGNSFSNKMGLKGCHDFAPFFALNDLFDWWQKSGTEAIRAHMAQLNRYLISEVASHLSWPLLKTGCDDLDGPLSAIKLPARIRSDGHEVTERLWQHHRIQVNAMTLGKSSYLVVSTDSENSPSDIDTLIQALKALC